ncbi:uncharacterized protein LOC132736303 isoform X2 [Ruditapes philippinarum]|uniref:uncharacterized protein LOC132736303 isoform X2 n=1 Tax=Ruditapes philippinarum TaxID=129788 RepID=UPI00295B32FC|nr:uncharacterized protein LOC132736303 isoform X2 [Ruditapes philippinarum]
MGKTEDRSTKIIKVIDTELTLSGAINEKDGIDLAESIVTTVYNKAVKKAGGDTDDYPKIRKVVEKMLEDIGNFPDVEVLPAEHKCIILKFKCSSYAALHSILIYLDSGAFRCILTELAVSLNTIEQIKSESITIGADLTLECLKDILDTLCSDASDENVYKRTIRMPIEVKTTDGMKRLWSMFEDGGATNRLNELSEAVFDELNTKITVTPSIGLSGVQDAIRQSDEHLKRLMDVSAVKVEHIIPVGEENRYQEKGMNDFLY